MLSFRNIKTIRINGFALNRSFASKVQSRESPLLISSAVISVLGGIAATFYLCSGDDKLARDLARLEQLKNTNFTDEYTKAVTKIKNYCDESVEKVQNVNPMSHVASWLTKNGEESFSLKDLDFSSVDNLMTSVTTSKYPQRSHFAPTKEDTCYFFNWLNSIIGSKQFSNPDAKLYTSKYISPLPISSPPVSSPPPRPPVSSPPSVSSPPVSSPPVSPSPVASPPVSPPVSSPPLSPPPVSSPPISPPPVSPPVSPPPQSPPVSTLAPVVTKPLPSDVSTSPPSPSRSETAPPSPSETAPLSPPLPESPYDKEVRERQISAISTVDKLKREELSLEEAKELLKEVEKYDALPALEELPSVLAMVQDLDNRKRKELGLPLRSLEEIEREGLEILGHRPHDFFDLLHHHLEDLTLSISDAFDQKYHETSLERAEDRGEEKRGVERRGWEKRGEEKRGEDRRLSSLGEWMNLSEKQVRESVSHQLKGDEEMKERVAGLIVEYLALRKTLEWRLRIEEQRGREKAIDELSQVVLLDVEREKQGLREKIYSLAQALQREQWEWKGEMEERMRERVEGVNEKLKTLYQEKVFDVERGCLARLNGMMGEIGGIERMVEREMREKTDYVDVFRVLSLSSILGDRWERREGVVDILERLAKEGGDLTRRTIQAIPSDVLRQTTAPLWTFQQISDRFVEERGRVEGLILTPDFALREVEEGGSFAMDAIKRGIQSVKRVVGIALGDVFAFARIRREEMDFTSYTNDRKRNLQTLDNISVALKENNLLLALRLFDESLDGVAKSHLAEWRDRCNATLYIQQVVRVISTEALLKMRSFDVMG